MYEAILNNFDVEVIKLVLSPVSNKEVLRKLIPSPTGQCKQHTIDYPHSTYI